VRTGGASGTIQPSSKPSIDDGALDALDRHRRVEDAQRARAFARRRADATGELREVVGLVQAVERLAPEAAVDQVVPLRDQVVDRAAGGHAVDQLAGVAEGNAAVHAARPLRAQRRLLQVQVEFVPILHPLQRRAVGGEFALIF
jgi:hypothetical protein